MIAAFLLALAHQAPEAAELRLSAVLDDVDAHAPQILAATERTGAAEHRAKAAGAWDDPFLAAGPDEWGPPDFPPGLRVQLSQVIPFPGKRGARSDAASALAQAAREDVDTLRRSLRVVATQLFFRGIYLHDALATNAHQQKLVSEAKASAEARYETGGTTHHEVLLAGAELAVLERDALALRRDLNVVLARLQELRGGIEGRPPSAGEPPQLIDDAPAGTAPASFEEAVRTQPELQAQSALVASAAAGERGANLAALPDVTLQLMTMQSFMEEEPSNYGAMVGVSLPIFFPWKQQENAAAAVREKRAREAEASALLFRLRAEWTEAEAQARSAEETVRLYKERVLPSTRIALESAETAYATQQAPLLELLTILRAGHQAELEAKAALLDVKLARLRQRELLSSPAVVRFAPASPTLFGGMGGGMRGGQMGGGPMGGMPAMSKPVRMGEGMAPPAPGAAAGEEQSGMGGM